jgi:hypothetical protein
LEHRVSQRNVEALQGHPMVAEYHEERDRLGRRLEEEVRQWEKVVKSRTRGEKEAMRREKRMLMSEAEKL